MRKQKKTINGITYEPYGIFNENIVKNDSIEYEPSMAATISGILFVELVVPPIYVFGYNLWEPVKAKNNKK